MHSELMVRSRLGRGNVELPEGATHLIKVGQTVSQTENKFGFFNFNSDCAGAIYPKYYNNQPIAYLYSSDQSNSTHVNLLTEDSTLGDLTARYLGRSDTKQISDLGAIQETDAWEIVLFTQSDVGKMIPIWLSTEVPPWAYQYNVTCMINNSPIPNNSAKFKFVFVDGSEETHSVGDTSKISILSTKILSYIEAIAVPAGINNHPFPIALSKFTQNYTKR